MLLFSVIHYSIVLTFVRVYFIKKKIKYFINQLVNQSITKNFNFCVIFVMCLSDYQQRQWGFREAPLSFCSSSSLQVSKVNHIHLHCIQIMVGLMIRSQLPSANEEQYKML